MSTFLQRYTLGIALALFSVCSGLALTADLSSFLHRRNQACTPVITYSGTGPATFCKDGSLRLEASLQGVHYIWRNGTEIVQQGSQAAYLATKAGSYTVEVQGVVGCAPAVTSEALVVTELALPTADFDVNIAYTCNGPAVATFISRSNGNGSNLRNYEWEFGDPASGQNNTTTTNTTATHSYANANNAEYTVSLTVTTENGCSHKIRKKIKVDRGHLINLSSPEEFRNCGGGALNLVVSDASEMKNGLLYEINWGDNSPVYSSPTAPRNLAHEYTNSGVYQLVYTVSFDNGCRLSRTIPVYNISNPSGGINSPGNTGGCAPVTYNFPVTGVENNDPSTIYIINFGDGTPEVTYTHQELPRAIPHEYTESSCNAPGGAYTVTFIARNACEETPGSIGGVRVFAKPVAGFTIPPQPFFCAGQPISFTNTTRPNAGLACNRNTTYIWNFGDGTPAVTQTSTTPLPSPPHTYTAPGTYTVSLTVSNSCGPSTYTDEITISEPPEARFTLDRTQGCADLTVRPTNNSIRANRYVWAVSPSSGYTLAPGSQLTDRAPTFIFNRAGRYELTLLAEGDCEVDTQSEWVEVQDVPEVTLPEPQTYCGPQTIRFDQNNAAHAPTFRENGSPITSYKWTLPTGAGFVSSSSGSQYPQISFPAAGTYIVRLTATNACGESEEVMQQITINPLPGAPTVTPETICQGGTATLRASSSGNTHFRWYDAATGGTLLEDGSATFTTPTLNTPGTYTYHVETRSPQNCTSATRTAVTVTVVPPLTSSSNSISTDPANADLSICANTAAPQLLGSVIPPVHGSTSFRWESSTDGNTFSPITGATHKDYTPGILSQTTSFRRVAVSTACGNHVSNVIRITVIPRPLAPAVSDREICKGAAATLSVSNAQTGITYTWYDAATGGNILGTGNTFSTPPLITPATYTYYVGAVNTEGCPATSREEVTVTVNSEIQGNTLSADQLICSGSLAQVIIGSAPGGTLTGGSGSYTYQWYSNTTGDPNNLNPLAGQTGPNLSPGIVNHKTWFYRRVFSGQCSDLSAPTVVDVKPVPTAPRLQAYSPVCQGRTATLRIDSPLPDGVYNWYDSPAATVPLYTGSVIITPALQASTVYYVSVTTPASDCPSPRTTVNVTVEQPIRNNTIGNVPGICIGQTAQVLTGSDPEGGTGTYTYVWQSSTDGTTFGPATGTATGKDYAPGNLSQTTWFRRVVTSGVCAASTSTPVRITVTPLIQDNIISLNGSSSICENSAPGTFSGPEPIGGEGPGSFSYSWEYSLDGTTFQTVSGTANAPTYVPGPLTRTTWFRRVATSGGCQLASNIIEVKVNPLPAAPLVSAPAEICRGNFATLSVTNPTGSYSWYSTADGTTPLATGATYQTPALQATTTYYVALTDANHCTSPRREVTIQVNPPLAANTISDDQVICSGQRPSLLTGPDPEGGNGTFVHFWEQSTDNQNYVPAVNAPLNSRDYHPPVLTQTTWYRRRVVSGGCEHISEPVQIVVNNVITGNTINGAQTICAGTSPQSLSGPQPTGGDSNFAYRWEMSTTGANGIFTPVLVNGDQAGYTPGTLSQTTWFRRVAISGGCENPSNVIEITVHQSIGNNILTAGTQTVCIDGSTTIIGSDPTGGNGSYVYLWEVSTLSATDGFVKAPGDNLDQHYTPTDLKQTSWFRRVAYSGPCAEHTSQAIQITVNPRITQNTITGEQKICTNTAPGLLTGTEPQGGGGSGSYTYLWEASTTGPNGIFSAAPGVNNDASYQAPVLTQPTWFRRTVFSLPCSPLTSNVIQVMVTPLITQNSIQGNQTVCTGGAPETFTGSTPAGGEGAPYTYRWQYSQNGQPFTDAPGNRNEATYKSGPLTQTTRFRRLVLSGNCINESNEIEVVVQEQISQNEILGAQSLCLGATPSELRGNNYPSGGSGRYTFEWQSSITGPDTGFGPAEGNNTEESYQPGAINRTTWFRRVVKGGLCQDSYSNAVEIKVTPPITNNRVLSPQAICQGTSPAMLTGTALAGGDGTYTYRWESSTQGPNAGFAPAAGTYTEATYTPGALSRTTWFRRVVMSQGCTNTSAAVAITVLSSVTGNSITTPTELVCIGSAPALLSGALPSGGSGHYGYVWEYSTDGITYAPAPGIHHEQNYTPGPLSRTTWFRRVVSSGSCPESFSNEVRITVSTPVTNNTISSPQRICSGSTPATLHGSTPAGGNGRYTYLWEMSTSSDQSGFMPATGINNAANYTPPALIRTTWFRRKVVSLPCQESVSPAVMITVDPIPVAPQAKGGTTCAGGSATLTATSLISGLELQWYAYEEGGVLLQTGNTFVTEPLVATKDYYVQTVNQFGCPSPRVKVTATVPPPSADAGKDQTIIVGRKAQLAATGGETYRWSPATDLSDPNIAAPLATPSTTTTYTVTVVTADGCTFTDEVTITVLPLITVTNAITLNGDGINETWYIENIEYYPNCRVQVFTRWGAKVFDSIGYKEPWNGTAQGNPLPMAAYYYIIQLNEEEEPISGSITLIK